MTTDAHALEVIAQALRPWNISSSVAEQIAQDVLDDLGSAGLQVFEAAPAQKESQ